MKRIDDLKHEYNELYFKQKKLTEEISALEKCFYAKVSDRRYTRNLMTYIEKEIDKLKGLYNVKD